MLAPGSVDFVGAAASSEPYTHLIGLGDFAPGGATEISPAASEAQAGVCGIMSNHPEGAQEHWGQRPAPLRAASLSLCTPGQRFACPRLISVALVDLFGEACFALFEHGLHTRKGRREYVAVLVSVLIGE